MANGRVDYRGMDYHQIYKAWSSQATIAANYKPYELDVIHKRWKRIGKLVAAGRF